MCSDEWATPRVAVTPPRAGVSGSPAPATVVPARAPRAPVRRWRLGVSDGSFDSTLYFGTARVDVWEHAVLASLQFRASERWTLQASGGVIVTGALSTGDATHRMRPGWLYGVAASYRLLDGAGWLPFVLISASISASGTATESSDAQGSGHHASLVSVDASAVLTVGKTLFRAISPYLVGRVFGGPVFWQREGALLTGTDAYHYQVGVGLSVALLQRFDAFFEYAPLGERRISAGAGLAF